MNSILSVLENPAWIVVFIMVFGGVVKFLWGDKNTRVEHKKRLNELQNLLFDCFVSLLTSFRISTDSGKILSGDPSKYENKITEIVEKASNVGFCSRFKYKAYIQIAKKYHKYWGELVGTNTSIKNLKEFIKLQQKMLKNIIYLGKKTGREREAEKIIAHTNFKN